MYSTQFKLMSWSGTDLVAHFEVVCSVAWPLNGGKAGVPCFDTNLSAFHTQIPADLYKHNMIYIMMKNSEVCIKTKSTPASIPLKGHVHVRHERTH